jgi:hypothetical protein
MSKARPTRTTNRLHFEDLDPKRFEDFCHSLVFPMHKWQSMHHIGRSGDDGGRDIRATEAMADGTTRKWAIQCKRYKSLGPKQAKQVVKDALVDGEHVDVLLLPVACPVSQKTHKAFQDEATARGIGQAIVWDATFIESTLYNHRKDLLSVYFDINLVEKAKNKEAELKRVMKLRGREDADDPGRVRGARRYFIIQKQSRCCQRR